MMMFHIPSALRSYTAQRGEVRADGATLADALAALDRQFPGIRFRIITEQETIRPHIRIFINDEQAPHLTTPLRADDRIFIVCALSGG
jgi:molybdopterin converting factor small subunit